MKYDRSGGILLHPTSLPGPYGAGDIGPAAHRWLEWLHEAGCGLWQVLPLGPTGYADSPYQCFSAFAGNPYLISPEALLADGLLSREDVWEIPSFPTEKVDYGWVIPWKLELLDKAFTRFQQSPANGLPQAFRQFRQAEAHWLEDFSLFMAIKQDLGGGSWADWPLDLRTRQPEALGEARSRLLTEIDRHAFYQFLFFRQWDMLRDHAHRLGIRIIGDIPIFVAHDSADVWANLDLFYTDSEGRLTAVAGVPPDYFSATGQLWGNPLYRWDIHKQRGYAWWISRFRAVLRLVDIIRLDHFRGFAGYWEIPAGMPTAEIGRWAPGPGKDFLYAVQNALGNLPIIAEDLGVITPDVVELRDTFDLPGMKVIQFAFLIGPEDPFLPHNYIRNCIVYTGTHDNDTTLGWFTSAPEPERKFALDYVGTTAEDIPWTMIRLVWRSIGDMAVVPMQDLLSLGPEARMNFPGTPSGNWSWRMSEADLSQELAARVKEINRLYSRLAKTS